MDDGRSLVYQIQIIHMLFSIQLKMKRKSEKKKENEKEKKKRRRGEAEIYVFSGRRKVTVVRAILFIPSPYLSLSNDVSVS